MDDCRRFLESYREAVSETNRLGKSRADISDMCRRITTTITGMPRGSGADRDKLLAALADAEDRVIRKYTEALQIRGRVEDFIDTIDNDVYRIILRLRYIELVPWAQMPRRLAQSGLYYNENYLYQIHGRALGQARVQWTKRKETTDD